MSLSTAQKTLLRSENQYSVLGLAILQPKTILACQISDYTGTDMVSEFDFGSVTEGSYSDVLAGMIVFVGSSAGAYDVGICRVRKAWTSSTAYTSEESSIAFANDLYITVIDAFEIRPKHLVVTSDEVFMDVDVAYSDQHENFDPIPIMGGHVVLDVDSYPATVSFPSVADSWVFDSTISDYLFEASDGVVTDETTTNPTLTISSYPTDGYIRVSLTLTAANGKTFTGHRYVLVFDPDHRPITDFTLDDCGATSDDGDWSARVTLSDSNDIDLLRFGSLAILFSKDYFDGEEGSVGLYAGRENIWMSGWIYEYSMIDDPEFKPRSFDIQGAGHWMSRMASFPTGVELSTSAATAWTEMQGLTVDKGLYHFLHWRTTVTQVMDVYLTDDTKYTGSTESAAGNLWDQILDIAESQILARPACNHNMMFAVKVPYNLIPYASRSGASELVMALETQDYTKQTEIRKQAPQISQVLLSGIAADEYGNGTSIYSLSPGHVPALLGDLLSLPNVLLEDQDQSNRLAGLVFAHENNPFPEIPLTLVGANRAFDIAPVLYGTITGLQEYSGVIVPTSIDLSYELDPNDPRGGKCVVEVTFESETDETDAIYINGDIPAGDGTFVPIPSLGKLPPLDPLDLPDIPPVSFPPTIPDGTDTDCGSEFLNFYNLVWSKPYLDGLDSTKLISRAVFSCKIRSNPRTPTYIDFSAKTHGDAASHIAVYGVLGGSRVAQATLASGIGLYTFRAYFNVLSDTLVDGFEIELDAGAGSTVESYSVGSTISSGSVGATSEAGATLGTTIGQIYSLEGDVGPWNTGGSDPHDAYTFEWYMNSWSPGGGGGLSGIGVIVGLGYSSDYGGDALAGERINAGNYGRVYFQADQTSVKFRVASGEFGDNSGSLGYIFRNAAVVARALDIYGAVLNNVCAP